MTIEDVRNTSGQCKGSLSKWSIVGLQDGKLDGPGYGSKITRGNHLGCDYVGMVLIMEGTQNRRLDFNSCP